MPSVPRYNQQVNQSALPNARVGTGAPAEAFGGGAASGRGVTQAASQIVSIMDKEREKADQLRIMDADSQAARLKNKLFYDPDSGAMNKRGKDAFGAVDEYSKQFDEQAREIEKGLSSPAQKAAFKERLAQHKGDLNNQLQKHVFQESQAYDNEVTEGRLVTAQEEATLNYQDPNILQRSLREQEIVIQQHADRMGKPAEWAQNKIKESKSKTHSAVIERMLVAGNDIEAENYYKNNKADFTARDITNAEKLVEAGSTRGFAQREADKLMKSGLSLSQSIEKAKEVAGESPKKRDALINEIKDQFNMKKIAQDENTKALTSRAYSIIENNGGNTKDINPRLREALISEGKWDSLEERALQVRSGKFIVTDKTKLYDLQQMAATPELRDSFLRENLDEYSSKISGPELKELKDVQASMRKGDTKNAETFRTKQQIVKETALASGVDTEDKEAMAELNRSVDERVKVLKEEGKPVDYQEIADDLMIKGTVPGTGVLGFFKTSKRVYETNEGDKVVIDYESIPRTEKMKIAETIKNRGGKPTEDAVLEVYKLKLEGIVKRGQ